MRVSCAWLENQNTKKKAFGGVIKFRDSVELRVYLGNPHTNQTKKFSPEIRNEKLFLIHLMWIIFDIFSPLLLGWSFFSFFLSFVSISLQSRIKFIFCIFVNIHDCGRSYFNIFMISFFLFGLLDASLKPRLWWMCVCASVKLWLFSLLKKKKEEHKTRVKSGNDSFVSSCIWFSREYFFEKKKREKQSLWELKNVK